KYCTLCVFIEFISNFEIFWISRKIEKIYFQFCITNFYMFYTKINAYCADISADELDDLTFLYQSIFIPVLHNNVLLYSFFQLLNHPSKSLLFSKYLALI